MADTTQVPDVRLYDQTGTLIPLPGPPPPQPSSPEIRIDGVDHDARDRYRLYPSRRLTPERISMILEMADAGDLYEWVQLCEEMVEKDPKIGSVMQTRVSAVLGTKHSIEPPELDEVDADQQPKAEEIAKFCQKAVQHSNEDELIADIMDSVGKPLSVDWIDWGRDPNDKVVPLLFRQIPTTHIRWSWREDVIRIWNPNGFSQLYGNIPATMIQAGAGPGYEDVGFTPAPYTTVRALNNRRRDHPTRAGLLRTAVWYYLFKNIALKDWVSYGDRFGMPMRIIKLDPTEFKNEAMYNAARKALRDMGSDASGVISKNADIEIVATPVSKGTDVFKAVIDYIDTSIAQLFLGHELSSQGSKGTGNLGISAAMQVRQDILEGDCQFCSEIIKRDVLTPIVGWNFGWDMVHLTPNYKFDFQPPRDLVAESTIMETVARTFPSFKFSEQQIRGDYGYDAPLEGDVSGIGDDDATDVLIPGKAAPGETSPADAAALQKVKPPPPIPIGTPDVTINSMLEDLNVLESEFTAFAATRRNAAAVTNQAKIDELAARGSRLVTGKVAEWRSQLQQLVVEGARDGVTFQEMASRLVEAYPKLDAAAVEKALREQMTLARLFGRQKSDG